MLARQKLRKHKTIKQLQILKQINKNMKLGKSCNKRARLRLEATTGLTWIKIYKWFFDKKGKAMCRPEVKCRGCAEQPRKIFRIFRVKDGDICEIKEKPLPVFKIERIAR